MKLKTPRWWYARDGRSGRVVRTLLKPASWLWAWATARRIARAQPDDPGVPVICVCEDAQQLAIVKRLVADFNVPVRIVGVPTVRESDGLALSSRNQRLDRRERELAPALYRALQRIERDIAAGVIDGATLKQAGFSEIPEDPALKLDYKNAFELD